LSKKCQCRRYDDVGINTSFEEELSKDCVCKHANFGARCRCERHAEALSYRAAVLEKLGKLAAARRDAEWALELCPTRLESYLRLAKIALGQNNQLLAWHVVTAGVKNGRDGKQATKDEFAKLLEWKTALNRRFYKKDPLVALAVQELTEMILSDFSIPEKCRLLRVSKSWRKWLMTSSSLWRELVFPQGYKPSLQAVANLVKYCGPRGFRTLVVADTAQFRFWDKRDTTLFNGSRGTTKLELRGGPLPSSTVQAWQLTRLTSLTIGSSCGPTGTAQPETPYLPQLLRRCRETLQMLDLTTDYLTIATHWPDLPRLRFLRLITTGRHRSNARWASRKLKLLRLKSPNLEQLWFSVQGSDVLHFHSSHPTHDPDTTLVLAKDLETLEKYDEESGSGKMPPAWTHLKAVILDPRLSLQFVFPGLKDGSGIPNLRYLRQYPNRPSNMFNDALTFCEELFGTDVQCPNHHQLQPFHHLLIGLEPGARPRPPNPSVVELSNLKTISIVIFIPQASEEETANTTQFLAGLSGITTLSIRLKANTRLYPSTRYSVIEEQLDQLVAGLMLLPVETLELTRDPDDFFSEELIAVAGRLLEMLFPLDAPTRNRGSMKTLKTVYTNMFFGVDIDSFRKRLSAPGASFYPTALPPPRFPVEPN